MYFQRSAGVDEWATLDNKVTFRLKVAFGHSRVSGSKFVNHEFINYGIVYAPINDTDQLD